MLFSLFQPVWADGGSNIVWHRSTCYLDGDNDDLYGYIHNFNHSAAYNAEIVSHLQQMYNNGQRHVRIPIFHGNFPESICPNDGVPANGRMALDSHIPRGYPPTPGHLSENCQTSFRALLAKVREIGFVQVMVSFFPASDNSPLTWHKGASEGYADDWKDDLFWENWRLIVNVSADLEAEQQRSGLSYYIDLMNEAIYPHESQVNPNDLEYRAICRTMERYCRELWNLYTAGFGKDHTVGFSINVGDSARVANFRNIYGDCRYGGQECNGPYVLSAHIYGEGTCDELCKFTAFHHALTDEGYPKENTGIIIGESFYNDPIAAANFDRARSPEETGGTGRTIFYVLQWPILRGQYCPRQLGQPLRELRPPVPMKDFNYYLQYGF